MSYINRQQHILIGLATVLYAGTTLATEYPHVKDEIPVLISGSGNNHNAQGIEAQDNLSVKKEILKIFQDAYNSEFNFGSLEPIKEQENKLIGLLQEVSEEEWKKLEQEIIVIYNDLAMNVSYGADWELTKAEISKFQAYLTDLYARSRAGQSSTGISDHFSRESLQARQELINMFKSFFENGRYSVEVAAETLQVNREQIKGLIAKIPEGQREDLKKQLLEIYDEGSLSITVVDYENFMKMVKKFPEDLEAIFMEVGSQSLSSEASTSTKSSLSSESVNNSKFVIETKKDSSSLLTLKKKSDLKSQDRDPSQGSTDFSQYSAAQLENAWKEGGIAYKELPIFRKWLSAILKVKSLQEVKDMMIAYPPRTRGLSEGQSINLNRNDAYARRNYFAEDRLMGK